MPDGFVIFSSAWLARRLELAEARVGIDCAEAARKLGATAEVLDMAGGHAVFTGPVSPFTQAIGVGMGQAVTGADIEALQEFFWSRGAATNIHLCPLADATLAEQLGARGYRPAEFNNMLMRMAPAQDVVYPETPAVEVREVEAHEIDNWAVTVMRGFLGRDEFTGPELEMARLSATADSRKILARVDGAIAGSAAFVVRDGVALLFGDCTLPAFRGRGVHLAMIRHRLREAALAGAEVVAATTMPGSMSQRNYERCAFQVMYTKAAMVLEVRG